MHWWSAVRVNARQASGHIFVMVVPNQESRFSECGRIANRGLNLTVASFHYLSFSAVCAL